MTANEILAITDFLSDEMTDAQAERLLIAPDRARKSDITAWEAPVRAGEYEEFLFGLAPEKIEVVKSRLIKNFGYCDICATDALNFVASIFAKGDSIKS